MYTHATTTRLNPASQQQQTKVMSSWKAEKHNCLFILCYKFPTETCQTTSLEWFKITQYISFHMHSHEPCMRSFNSNTYVSCVLASCVTWSHVGTNTSWVLTHSSHYFAFTQVGCSLVPRPTRPPTKVGMVTMRYSAWCYCTIISDDGTIM